MHDTLSHVEGRKEGRKEKTSRHKDIVTAAAAAATAAGAAADDDEEDTGQ